MLTLSDQSIFCQLGSHLLYAGLPASRTVERLPDMINQPDLTLAHMKSLVNKPIFMESAHLIPERKCCQTNSKADKIDVIRLLEDKLCALLCKANSYQ